MFNPTHPNTEEKLNLGIRRGEKEDGGKGESFGIKAYDRCTAPKIFWRMNSSVWKGPKELLAFPR